MTLTTEEVQTVAIMMGYNANELDFTKFLGFLNVTQEIFVRNSLIEVARIEALIKASITNAQASRVEDIDINIEYRTSLIVAAAYEIVKIGKYINYPIRKNLYSVEDLPRAKKQETSD